MNLQRILGRSHAGRYPNRHVGVLVLVTFLCSLVAPVASAAEVLDQRQEVVNSALSVPGGFSQSQTFTASLSGGLSRVSVHVSNLLSGVDLTAELQGVTPDGLPDGTALASKSLAFSSPSSARWVEVSFDQAPTVTAGTRYAIVLKPASPFAWSTATTAPYAGGKAWTRDDTWWEEQADYAFRTYVSGGNAPPVANGDTYETDEESPLAVGAPGVLGNDTDADGQSLTAVLGQWPVHGSLTLNSDGSFSYRPDANFSGSDTFTYKAYDGIHYAEPATVTVTVRPVNDAPVLAGVAERSVQAGDTITFAVSAADPDRTDTLTYSLVGAPAGAVIDAAAGLFHWTPDAAQVGVHTFTVRVADNGSPALSDEADLTVQVTEPPSGVSTGGKVTGGGWIAEGEGKGHFAFTVAAQKDGSLKGNAHYSFRGADGQVYRIRAVVWEVLTVDPAASLASFQARSTVEQIDEATGEVLAAWENWRMTVHLEDARPDQITITVLDETGGRWHRVSSALRGGQIVIHGSTK